MKTSMVYRYAKVVILAFAATFILGSCEQFFGKTAKVEGALVTISAMGDIVPVGAKTLRPAASLIQVASYSFTLTPSSGAPVEGTSTTASKSFSGLAAGSWTVAIKGLSSTAAELLVGSASFTVTAGADVAVPVTMTPSVGTGTANLTFNLPAFVTSISGTIQREASGSTVTDIATKLSLAGGVANYTDTLAAGTYALNLTLRNSQSAVVGMIIESLDIFSGFATASAMTLRDSDLNKPPVAPTLTANAGDGSVSLTIGSVPGATGYKVYYKANSATATTGDTLATGSPFTILNPVVSDLTNGTQYAFVATAINAAGEGAASAVVTSKPFNFAGEMVSVVGGSFTQGRQVTVSSFYIGQYEVTFDQYDAFCAATSRALPSDSGFGRGTRPVVNVSWSDAVEFCNWLSGTKGLQAAYSGSGTTWTLDITKSGYRLPTEAEWEYAARGGIWNRSYTYSGSVDANAVAWYSGNSGSATHPVGGKAANDLGIYDMSGNVWEWNHDWYAGSYPGSAETDPVGPALGTYRVVRGGSWTNTADTSAVASRGYYTSGFTPGTLGFRLARLDPNAATVPTNLIATAGIGQVSLSWTASTNATSYCVYYKSGSTTATTSDVKVTGPMISGTTAAMLGLAAGTQYGFVVTALKGLVESPASLPATATTAPSNLVSTNIGTLKGIPGGSFNNGTSVVTLSAFRMSQHEITQSQYQAVMGNNPSYFTSNSDAANCPVEQVTWYDAVEFCNKLSALESRANVYTITGRSPLTGYPITSATVTQDLTKSGYRLPTEAQWEYAARGGTTGTYYWGEATDDATVGQYAWFSSNSSSKTHAVGQKTANAYGLYGMAGNAFEWVWDWYGTYASGAQTDPTGASSGSYRVLRGGAWTISSSYITSAYRGYGGSSDRLNSLGFRVIAP